MAVLHEAVKAGDAQVGAAFLNFGGDVGGALEKHVDTGYRRDGAGVAARVGTAHLDAARCQEPHRGLAQFAVAWNYESQVAT